MGYLGMMLETNNRGNIFLVTMSYLLASSLMLLYKLPITSSIIFDGDSQRNILIIPQLQITTPWPVMHFFVVIGHMLTSLDYETIAKWLPFVWFAALMAIIYLWLREVYGSGSKAVLPLSLLAVTQPIIFYASRYHQECLAQVFLFSLIFCLSKYERGKSFWYLPGAYFSILLVVCTHHLTALLTCIFLGFYWLLCRGRVIFSFLFFSIVLTLIYWWFIDTSFGKMLLTLITQVPISNTFIISTVVFLVVSLTSVYFAYRSWGNKEHDTVYALVLTAILCLAGASFASLYDWFGIIKWVKPFFHFKRLFAWAILLLLPSLPLFLENMTPRQVKRSFIPIGFVYVLLNTILFAVSPNVWG